MLPQKFMHAAFWNAFNVFLYKIILQTHQACLFYVVSKELFGISGTLFSSIYLLINVTNFGFDYSLFAFYQYFTTCQNNFSKMMHYFAIRSIIVMGTTALLLIFLHHFSYLPQISFITQFVSTPLMCILAIIFMLESMKKSFELFAHLSFLNKAITFVEIFSLLTYISIVWIYYFLFGYINLYVIFSAMCIMSYFELFLVLQRLMKFQKTLPSNCPTLSQPTTQKIIFNQASNYINQITKALFSPNFIILFLAYHVGVIKAGLIKLIIDIIIVLYMLLNRAVGIPSGALMSRRASAITSDISSDFPHFSVTFLKITNAYIQFLYAIFIIFCCAITACFIRSDCIDNSLLINILFFTFAGFLEYLLITYEKLYLTQNAAEKLAIINFIALFCLIPMLWFSNALPNEYLLLPFVMIRLFSFIIITLLSYKIWNIIPNFHIKLKTLGFTLLPVIGIVAWYLHF